MLCLCGNDFDRSRVVTGCDTKCLVPNTQEKCGGDSNKILVTRVSGEFLWGDTRDILNSIAL